MHFGRILEGLWDGRVKSLSTAKAPAWCNLIQDFLPVPSLCLTQSDLPAEGIIVLGDYCHIAPDLPLGDVLAEELDLDVPDQSLVIMIPEALLRETTSAAEISHAVGRALAQAAVMIAEREWLGSNSEIAALHALIDLYQNVDTEPPRRLGLKAPAFYDAFADELHALFGWDILEPCHAEANAPVTEVHAVFSARVDAWKISKGPLTRDPLAERAAHSSPNGHRTPPYHHIQDGV